MHAAPSNIAAPSNVLAPRAAAARTMRAMYYDKYGAPELVTLREIVRPRIDDHGVLVRVRAASLHAGDVFVLRGSPFPVRLMTGLFAPKYGVPGMSFAGTVEAVGERVSRYAPGDEVFGECDGACAELAKTRVERIAPKPASLSFEAAAALPTSGVAALHGLREAGKVRPGQKVLVNGASGGVGTFAVQIAKALGAEVTGVCSKANVELVRSIGADHVIDYREEDFTTLGPCLDLILDNVENRTLADCRRALTRDGTLVLNSGTGARGFALLRRLLAPLVLAPFVRHRLRRYVCEANHDDLMTLSELATAGKLMPVIETKLSLEETPEGLRHVESGRARGKVVVTI